MIFQLIIIGRYPDSLVDPVVLIDVLKVSVEGCNRLTQDLEVEIWILIERIQLFSVFSQNPFSLVSSIS